MRSTYGKITYPYGTYVIGTNNVAYTYFTYMTVAPIGRVS